MSILKCSNINLEHEFYDIESVRKILESEYFDSELFQELVRRNFLVGVRLPRAQQEKEKEDTLFFHRNDIYICDYLMKINFSLTEKELNIYGLSKYWFEDNFFVKRIKISNGTFVIYKESEKKVIPVFVRNILYNFCAEEDREQCNLCRFEFLGITIVTSNVVVREYVESALYRKHKLDRIKYSNFANSSSYMGSKKKIVGFVIESILPHANSDTVFLDIMCGSGAVSNALAQVGDVYASDAEKFCQLLAKIQGKGYTKKKAQKLLNEIYDKYNENIIELQKKFKNELAEEDEIFHMDLNEKEEILAKYNNFIDTFPLYSSTSFSDEQIINAVKCRKDKPQLYPYCLCTYYFTNIYFGLTQSVQLDSIRYAIDCIDKGVDRDWALGALIVTVSMIGTTSAGHFAQPRKLDVNSLEKILIQREKSAWLEFSKRFITLASESERYPYTVTNIEGPWQRALDDVGTLVGENVIVYLDAPYKREEYSRYYHVLETLTLYDYPESENKGRMRSKIKGERFRTEFFTKDKNKVEKNFVSIISSILRKGMICAWSYSDNGDADVTKVINLVKAECECEVYIYGIPHVHQTQRKKMSNETCRLRVMEYCVVFIG